MHSSPPPSPPPASSFPIDTVALHLDGAGPIRVQEATPEYWAAVGRPEFRRGQILSVFSYTETWQYRERHPDADELAIVLDGRIDLLLDDGHGEYAIPCATGTGVVIPTGVWHRLRVPTPCTVLFITPVPARTQHQDVPEPTTNETAGS